MSEEASIPNSDASLVTPEPTRSDTPPKTFERNEFGLVKGLGYVFKEDGRIDWRKMISPEFLVPNNEKTKETDISKLDDSMLLILLAGFKDVAQIRGYNAVRYKVTSQCPDNVITVCEIDFIPNYETEGKPRTFSAIGDATTINTTSFGRKFLGPISENRAFVRCVRNFLNIPVAGKDEVSGDKEPEDGATPHNLLASVMREKGVTLEKVLAKLLEEKFPNADKFTALTDIPKIKAFELISRLRKIPQSKT